jgi:hypothetical protein
MAEGGTMARMALVRALILSMTDEKTIGCTVLGSNRRSESHSQRTQPSQKQTKQFLKVKDKKKKTPRR